MCWDLNLGPQAWTAGILLIEPSLLSATILTIYQQSEELIDSNGVEHDWLIMDKLQSISGLTQYKFISITHKTQLPRELTTIYLKHSVRSWC